MSRRDIGVAIGLPEPYAGQLAALRARFHDPQAALVPPHITLLPPTAVPDERLDDVEEHLRAVASQSGPFPIELRGHGTFRPVSAVVFVPLSSGIAPCEVLEARIRSGPLRRELKFPYHPHVTVAHDVPDELLDAAYAAVDDYRASMQVWGFSLFERDRGGRWRPMRDFSFGQGAAGAAGPHAPARWL